MDVPGRIVRGITLRRVHVSRNSSHLDSFALKDLLSPHCPSGQVLELSHSMTKQNPLVLVHLGTAQDALVPQMVEQLVDFFKDLDVEVPAQVIEVPKISQDIVPQRSADLVPQIVEQLVEVPTIVSYSSLQRDVEHRVDIPVPGRGGRIAGLQGSSSGQSSPVSIVEQIFDIPRGGPPGFPGSPAAQAWISARLLEQMFDCIPDPGHSSSSSSHRPAGISEDTDEPGDGVFRTFPPGKKSAEVAGQVSADLPRHVSSWTPGGLCASQGGP